MQEQSHRATTRLSSPGIKPEAAQGQLAHETQTNTLTSMQLANASQEPPQAQRCAETPQAALTLASLGRGPLLNGGSDAPARCLPVLRSSLRLHAARSVRDCCCFIVAAGAISAGYCLPSSLVEQGLHAYGHVQCSDHHDR